MLLFDSLPLPRLPLVQRLMAEMPELVSVDPVLRQEAAMDGSGLEGKTPDAVCTPTCVEDVVVLVEMCREAGSPLTVRGGGTGGAGGAVPVRGGIVLATNGLSEHRWDDDVLVVGAGLSVDGVDAAAGSRGRFLPIRPGGEPGRASIGGLVASGASGPYSVGYGSIRNYIRFMYLVTGAGELIRVGGAHAGRAAGLELTDLLVGSEGQLGVITEIGLDLPPATAFVESTRFVPSLGPALETIAASGRARGLVFADAATVQLLARSHQRVLPNLPAIVLATTAEDAEAALPPHEVVGNTFEIALGDFEREVTEAIRARHPDATLLRGTPRPPLTGIGDVLDRLSARAAKAGFPLYVFGDGLGTLHVVIPAPSDDPEGWDRATDVLEATLEATVDAGGTARGAFGAGLLGVRWARRERGLQLDVVKRVKAAFDPAGILNPGKLP